MTRAILHIGTEKTGTTALQSYLATHRDALAQRGFRYSRVAGKTNHLRLYLYASEGVGHAKTMIDRIGRNSDKEELEANFFKSLENEVYEYNDKIFVFSNEHCRGRLSRAQIVRLYDLLSGLFDEIKVLVYIRRQDELAVSHYSTALKAGHTRENVIPDTDVKDYFYDYWRFLHRWESIFGEDMLGVRLFEKGALQGDSVVTDFCEATGIPRFPSKDKRKNPSLLPPYQEFLRQMNIRLLSDTPDRESGARIRLLRMLLVKLGSGPGRLPTRAEAERFYQVYAESNEKVRKKFFPERAALFNEDFSRYPEEAQPLSLDVDRALDITAELWKIIAENQRFAGETQQVEQALALSEAREGQSKQARSETDINRRRTAGQPSTSFSEQSK